MRTVPPFTALRVAVNLIVALRAFLFLYLKTVYNLFTLYYNNICKKMK